MKYVSLQLQFVMKILQSIWISVEGGGDSGKDDTSEKDMEEEEEECKIQIHFFDNKGTKVSSLLS